MAAITICDPDRTQTCNLLIRSQMLYSIKLRGLAGCGCETGCKYRKIVIIYSEGAKKLKLPYDQKPNTIY
jgi:hypothetical protein